MDRWIAGQGILIDYVAAASSALEILNSRLARLQSDLANRSVPLARVKAEALPELASAADRFEAIGQDLRRLVTYLADEA